MRPINFLQTYSRTFVSPLWVVVTNVRSATIIFCLFPVWNISPSPTCVHCFNNVLSCYLHKGTLTWLVETIRGPEALLLLQGSQGHLGTAVVFSCVRTFGAYTKASRSSECLRDVWVLGVRSVLSSADLSTSHRGPPRRRCSVNQLQFAPGHIRHIY